jgi:hypothetical protein
MHALKLLSVALAPFWAIVFQELDSGCVTLRSKHYSLFALHKCEVLETLSLHVGVR